MSNPIYTRSAILVTPDDAGIPRASTVFLTEEAWNLINNGLQVRLTVDPADPTQLATRPCETELVTVLCRRIDTFGLSPRVLNCYASLDVVCLWQAVIISETETMKTKNFGRKCRNEMLDLFQTLHSRLSFGMSPAEACIIEARRKTSQR